MIEFAALIFILITAPIWIPLLFMAAGAVIILALGAALVLFVVYLITASGGEVTTVGDQVGIVFIITALVLMARSAWVGRKKENV